VHIEIEAAHALAAIENVEDCNICVPRRNIGTAKFDLEQTCRGL
jgi:hypothetical protein